MSTRAASPKARNGGGVGAGAPPTVRGVDKINCTYPIDFNPRTLYTRFRTQMPFSAKEDKNSLIPLKIPLDFIFLTQWNAVQSKFYDSRVR